MSTTRARPALILTTVAAVVLLVIVWLFLDDDLAGRAEIQPAVGGVGVQAPSSASPVGPVEAASGAQSFGQEGTEAEHPAVNSNGKTVLGPQVQAVLDRTGESIEDYERYNKIDKEITDYIMSSGGYAAESYLAHNNVFVAASELYKSEVAGKAMSGTTAGQEEQAKGALKAYLDEMEEHWRVTNVPVPAWYRGLEDFSYRFAIERRQQWREAYVLRSGWVENRLPALEAELLGILGPPASGEHHLDLPARR